MINVKIKYKRTHADCGGKIEYIAKLNSLKEIIRCTKCGAEESNIPTI